MKIKLSGGEFEIFHCSNQISRDTQTISKTKGRIVLSMGIALIGRQLEIFRCSN
jgi:hypothetical protein